MLYIHITFTKTDIKARTSSLDEYPLSKDLLDYLLSRISTIEARAKHEHFCRST